MYSYTDVGICESLIVVSFNLKPIEKVVLMTMMMIYYYLFIMNYNNLLFVI